MMTSKSSDLALLQRKFSLFCCLNAAINITKASSNFLSEQNARSVYQSSWGEINKYLISFGEKDFGESSKSLSNSFVGNNAEKLPENLLEVRRNNFSGPRRRLDVDDKVVELMIGIKDQIGSECRNIQEQMNSRFEKIGEQMARIELNQTKTSEKLNALETTIKERTAKWKTGWLIASPIIAVVVSYFLNLFFGR
jgi:hypothetical protein